MNVYLLLDILLLILIALFVPIGFWRGVQRELLVTLGILFGAALAAEWAEPWGADLAGFAGLREAGGAFMIAVLFLIGSTFLLGYGAGAALPLPRPGWVARVFGALVAGVNGALLLSYALQDIRFYLLSDQNPAFLERAAVAQFLATGIGWLLLGSAVVALPLVVLLALLGRGSYVEEVPAEVPNPAVDPAATRLFPPRVSSSLNDEATVAYKTEPPVTATRPTDETLPVRVQPGTDSAPRGGGAAVDAELAALLQDGQETIQIQTTPHGESSPPVVDGKCPHCHADVSNAEVFCPRCGQVL
ncbi:MAG: CvpA family protein [Sphaerobacter sp.]|nr:CvpA family protein [Sphaerobacter sp.]